MPELPEVEVLVRHLAPLLRGKTIAQVAVRRPKVIAPTSVAELKRELLGARFHDVSRRGKYLLFTLRRPGRPASLLLGHLGMTGRMYLLPRETPWPKHTAVACDLGREQFIFEDTRYFGRLTLATASLSKLGPEPLGQKFPVGDFAAALKRSRQAIKVKLLDQSLVAGVGNIYASEALYCAGISPEQPACELSAREARSLWRAIRQVLRDAIARGSTVPLNYSGKGKRDGLFYFGRAPGVPDFYEERLRVYDRAGRPCGRCRSPIQRLVQGGRSTYYCPECQRA